MFCSNFSSKLRQDLIFPRFQQRRIQFQRGKSHSTPSKTERNQWVWMKKQFRCNNSVRIHTYNSMHGLCLIFPKKQRIVITAVTPPMTIKPIPCNHKLSPTVLKHSQCILSLFFHSLLFTEQLFIRTILDVSENSNRQN